MGRRGGGEGALPTVLGLLSPHVIGLAEFHDLLQPDVSEGGRWPPEDGRRKGNWLNGRDPCTVLSVSDPLPPIRV